MPEKPKTDKKKEQGKKKAIESKEEKFLRLAPVRVNKILNQLRILGNCSNRNNYEFTQEQVESIIMEIQNSLDIVHSKFIENAKMNVDFKF